MKTRRNRKPRRSLEEQRRIYDEFMDGATYHSLVSKYMISSATISKIIKQFEES